MKPTIIIDTREQTPWTFSRFPTECGTLPTGDYSIKGLTRLIVVERKSLPDLLGCIGHDRERFTAELQRLRGYRFRLVIIEGTAGLITAGHDWCQLCGGKGRISDGLILLRHGRKCPQCEGKRTLPWRSKIKPNHVFGALASWTGKYEIGFWPGGMRADCADFAERFLANAAETIARERAVADEVVARMAEGDEG